MKIDIHAHILPESWPDLRERYGYGGFLQLEHHEPGRARMMQDGRLFREIPQTCWDPARRVEELDRYGIDVQVLSTVPVMFSYWAQPEHTHDLARLLNDRLADVVSLYPKRFVGLGTLPMQDTGRAVEELERCVRHLGMPGVQIGSHVNGRNLDDEEVVAVLEAAADLDAAVFVHPWDMMGRERMTDYWLAWLVGMPAETTLAICSLIFGGVLDRLPTLRIGFAHGGGAFAGTLGRIEHGYRVRPDLCAVKGASNPRSYLGRFYVDSAVHDAAGLRQLIALVGADRVAIGSDYPFPLGEHVPGTLVDSLDDLTPEVRDQLSAGTALQFLGRSADDFRR